MHECKNERVFDLFEKRFDKQDESLEEIKVALADLRESSVEMKTESKLKERGIMAAISLIFVVIGELLFRGK